MRPPFQLARVPRNWRSHWLSSGRRTHSKATLRQWRRSGGRGDGDGVVLMDAIGAPGTLTVALPQSTRRASAQVAALGSPSVASPPSESPCERREQRIALRRASRSPSAPAGAAAVSAYPIARIGDGRPGRSRRCALPTTAFLETRQVAPDLPRRVSLSPKLPQPCDGRVCPFAMAHGDAP